MNQAIEIEYKQLLTFTEFSLIMSRYQLTDISPVTQTNYYFDTSDSYLRSQSAGLRIRIKQSTAELTLKTPHEEHLMETTQSLTLQEAKAMIQKEHLTPPQSLQHQLDSLLLNHQTPLLLQATLKTIRRERQLDNGVLIVLDHSHYGTCEDFELEVEAPTADLGMHYFYSILSSCDIQKRPTPNKIERAFTHFQTSK